MSFGDPDTNIPTFGSVMPSGRGTTSKIFDLSFLACQIQKEAFDAIEPRCFNRALFVFGGKPNRTKQLDVVAAQ